MTDNISDFDIEELVRGMHSIGDDVDILEYVHGKYTIDWDDFCYLIRNLMPLIIVGESPLTGNVYRGFGKDGWFFIKQKV